MITRWRLAICAVLVGLAALAVLPWQLAERSVEQYLLSSLSQTFRMRTATSSSGAVALLPYPRIIANDVAVTSADGVITARIPRLRADLKLLPLLVGRIEVEQISLFAPQIDVLLPAEQRDPLHLLSSHLLSSMPDLPRVVITDAGSVFLRRGSSIVSTIREINVDIAAHIKGEAFQTSGSAVWRGEQLNFAFATNSPNRAVLPMMRVRSDFLTVDFASGRSVPQNSPQTPTLDGQLQISAKSMSRLGTWLASGSPVMLPLGNTMVGGRLRLSEEGAQISSAVVTLGSDSLDGALDWRRVERRWRLTGTLAGKSLDIGRPLSGIDLKRITMPEATSTSPIDIDDLLTHDIDLRMSLQRVRFPHLVLNDVAGHVMATDQRFDISITNAGLYGGVVRGRGSVARAPVGLELRTQVTAERVDLAQLSQDFFEARHLTGQGAFQHNLETNGRLAVELVTNANGRFVATARNGEFVGTNLNDAMRRIERQPLSVARDWRGGRTSYEQLALTGVVSDGIIELSEARGSGPAFRLAMDGQISMLDRLVKLNGNVQSANGAASVSFDIVGPLAEPSIQIDARSFLERSGAAAPLLPQRAN